MDADERTRLRALREGIALPWEAMEDHYDDGDGPVRMAVLCPHGDTDDRDTVATIDMGYGEECDTAHAALIVGAVNALGPLLDVLERAERERDEARAGVGRLRGRLFDAWCALGSPGCGWDFLGMTEAEYRAWVARGGA